MLMIHGRKWPTGYDIPKTGQSGAEGGGGTDDVRGGKVSTHNMCTNGVGPGQTVSQGAAGDRM